MYEILIAILLIGAFFYIGKKRLSDLKQNTEQPFRNFEAQAKIRRDLLKRLVAMDLELGQNYDRIIEKIDEHCNAYSEGKVPFNSWIETENNLTSDLAEALPLLNSIPYNDMPDMLLDVLKALRNSAAGYVVAAEDYNAAITDYNNAVIMFPSNAYALMFNYRLRKPVVVPTTNIQNP